MAELVKQTATAIAVSDSLTTLIDWVSIEMLAGFTIVIENAGGGSADDITDIQIDTSSDGGVTSSLDQHADTPAVPVSAGNSKKATFTETASFIRIRDICAAGNDTTANAILLADTTLVRICTLADVKDRLGITDTEHDGTINRIIAGLESVFNSKTNRQLIINAADVTEYHTGESQHINTTRYPIASITSIKEAYDYDFDSADALVANSGYRIISGGKNGIIYRMYNKWLKNEDGIQVVYRGGYAPAGQAPGAGETALPDDLREAAIEQASFIFKRRDDIGLSSTSHDGGSINKFSAMKLLPMVSEILDRYRRPSL